jgi:hypothetical protein
MAAMGWLLTPALDQAYYFYNSKFSFNHYANSTLDHWTSLLEYNSTLSGATLSAETAEYYMGSSVVDIPVWTGDDLYAYTSGWSRVTSSDGNPVPNYWTALNAWKSNPAVAGTIAWGFVNSPHTLNVYDAFTQWDVFVLSEIYDSLMVVNPLNPGQMFSSLSSGVATKCSITSAVPCDPAHLGYTPPSGTVETLRFSLRPDAYWQDARLLNSSDIRFSVLSYRDTPTASYNSVVQDVLDVHVLGSSGFDVNFGRTSPFHLFNIGTLPIIPAHIWATGGVCNSSSCTADPTKTALLFDPVANHVLIGSGPYACKDINTGQLGGGCTSTGYQSVPAGGAISLKRFGLGLPPGGSPSGTYFKSAGTLALDIWSGNNGDSNHDSTIVGSAAFCLNKAVGTAGCTQWQRGIGNPGAGTPVNVGQVSVVIRFSQDGNWVSPFNWLPGIPAACCPFSSNPPTGLQSPTPVLYEGTSTLNPCSVDSVNGYDC